MEAEQSLSGTRCRCPQCNILLLVPPVVVPPPVAGPPAKFPEAPPPADKPTLTKSTETLPQIQLGPPGKRREKTVDPQAVRTLAEPDLLHIPCPKGHLLETPRDMLNQVAECPFCHARFRLRREKSVEYQRRKAEQEEIRQLRLGSAWLRWAIIAAVLVVLSLVGLALLVRGD